MTACSNDEQTPDNGTPVLNGSDLIVTTESLVEGDGMTRSYLSRDMQSRIYSVDDELRVYDNDLWRYDIYKFKWNDESQKSGVFSRSNPTTNLTSDAKWALYPKAGVVRGTWDFDLETGIAETVAWMRIGIDEEGNPSPLVYDGTYSASDTTHGKALFKDIVPRWGEVTATGNGSTLVTHLSYLTGILRLQLAGTPAHADHVKVQLFEGGTTPLYITGVFKAVLAVDDEKQTDACLATSSHQDGTGSTEIVIDLSQASSDLEGNDASKSVLFVPLVTTATAVDIVVSASSDGGQTYTEFKRFQNKTIQRAKIYGNSQEYVFGNE